MNLLVLLSFCILATYFDLRYRKIPNRLMLIMFTVGILFSLSDHRGIDFLLGTFLCCIVLLIPFALNQLGAGDVKLISTIGGYVGINIVSVFIYFSIIGAVVALVFMYLSQKKYLIDTKQIPYALPISLGVLTYMCYGGLF